MLTTTLSGRCCDPLTSYALDVYTEFFNPLALVRTLPSNTQDTAKVASISINTIPYQSSSRTPRTQPSQDVRQKEESGTRSCSIKGLCRRHQTFASTSPTSNKNQIVLGTHHLVFPAHRPCLRHTDRNWKYQSKSVSVDEHLFHQDRPIRCDTRFGAKCGAHQQHSTNSRPA